jgi:hypothetical protein
VIRKEVNTKGILVSILLIAVLSMMFAAPLAAAEGATIRTDKADYAPEETVTIFGSGFNAFTDATVTIERPNGWIDTIPAVADGIGDFTCTYQLDGITGSYMVTATDETGNTATTTFTDAELVNVEVVSGVGNAVIEVEQGQTVSFTINLSATGQLRNTITSENPSKARVHTVYTVDDTASSGTFSAWYDFWSDGTGSPASPATWTGKPTPYQISATAYAASDATPGDYSIRILAETSNPISSPPGHTLRDETPDSLTIHVVAATTPLSITAPADITVEGNTIGGATEVDLGTATASGGTPPYTITNDAPSTFPLGGTTVTWTVEDDDGATATDTQYVTVQDTTPPTITAPADITVEGNTLGGANIADIGTATASDVVWGSLTPSNDHPSTFYSLGATTVTWSATDGSGNTGTATQTVTVVDTTPPTITILYGLDPLQDLGVYQIGKSLTFSASDIVWGTVSCSATLDGETISSGFTPTEAGVYTLVVTATDGSGNTATETRMFVIYDPNGGFVTGGGWINSPAGAYAADPALTGKATFGFVSKYQKGANVPTGNTEFQFHAAGMNFKSTSYEWLVIAGTKAMYKGVGTINGAGNYGFMLSAIDGAKGNPDKFRIRIWEMDGGLVYDNQKGASDTDNPTTTIAGGSIDIHK